MLSPLRMALVFGALPLLAAGAAVTAFGGAGAQHHAASHQVPALRAVAAEPDEHLSGGAATSPKTPNRDAFSHFSVGMSLAREADFKIGNAIFRRLWVSAPSSTTGTDGLGPLYNSRGCQNCHLMDGRGHPPRANWPEDTATSMFLRLSIPPQTPEQTRFLAEHRTNVIPEPTYGGQLQNYGVRGHDAEGQMQIAYADKPERLRDGTVVKLRRPTYSIANLGYGPLHSQTMTSPRVAPQMIGLGLLEAIPEEQIRAAADPDDANGDGISGRTNEVWSLEQSRVMLGRFGWKAGNPTVRQQSAEAAAIDLGLSNALFPLPSGDCTNAQPFCLNAPNGNTERHGNLELSPQLLDLVTFYTQNLAVPVRRNHDDPTVLHGKALFRSLNCSGCHRGPYTTGTVADQPHLSGQKIWPYTDLLLHDMGEDLADHRPEGVANGREWRTPPLWGIGLTEAVSGHTLFLHDGRARSLEEAILWHGGEAEMARNGYAALNKHDRDALIAFLKSL
jgi:CxxC motif-containing protein (DUF1111 family)